MLYTLEELEEIQQLADRVDISLIDLLRLKSHLMSGGTTPKSSSQGCTSGESTGFCLLTPATSNKGFDSTENSPPRSSVVQDEGTSYVEQRTSLPHAGLYQASSLLQPESEAASQWHSTPTSNSHEVPTLLPQFCNYDQTIPASSYWPLLSPSDWNPDAMFPGWPTLYAPPACDTTMEPHPIPELSKSGPSHASSTVTSRVKHHIDAEMSFSAKRPRLNSHRTTSSRQHPNMEALPSMIQKRSPERACIRCSIQHVECKSNPLDPRGCCERCTNPRLKIQLPCLRYRITDAVLYRPGSSLPVYHDFDFTGPNAGSLPYAEPLAGSDEWIWLAQADQSPMKIRVCRFRVPASHFNAVPSHKKPLYEHRYMVANAGEAAEATLESVVKHASALARRGVGARGEIYWRVFDAAFKMANSCPLLYDVLRLWSSCRLMEGGWYILSKNNLGLPVNHSGRAVPSPLLNAQLHAVDATKVIGPLTESVMGRLEKLVTANKKDHFYEVFLCTFILLHNYEKMVARQRTVAIKRKAKVVYTNMPYIRAMQVGSKALLAYFHYTCKGFMLFQADFDLTSAPILAQLPEEQKSVLQAVRDFAIADKERLTRLSHTDQYHQQDWFISQLFDPAWQPRSTWEYSPHVEVQQ